MGAVFALTQGADGGGAAASRALGRQGGRLARVYRGEWLLVFLVLGWGEA